LRGIHLVDDADAVDPTPWSGLGLVEFSIAPHYRSDHSESEAIDRVVAYFEEHALPYRALGDGHALVVEDSVTRLVGDESSRTS